LETVTKGVAQKKGSHHQTTKKASSRRGNSKSVRVPLEGAKTITGTKFAATGKGPEKEMVRAAGEG